MADFDSENWVWARIVLFGLVVVAFIGAFVVTVTTPCDEGSIKNDQIIVEGYGFGGNMKVCRSGKWVDLKIKDLK